MKRISLALLVAAVSGCASTTGGTENSLDSLLSLQAPRAKLSSAELTKVRKHPLGSSGNPVRAEGPGGERAYLQRLRCPEGTPPIFNRIGSSGNGLSPYGAIMDLYEVACDAPPARTIYIDMYHPGHVESRAVPGFTMTNAGGE
jgi:hypothetical protein